jgi:PilZ domain
MTMNERRAAQRFRVFKGGTIAFAGGGAACTVRNLSASGAAIELDGLVALPPSFTLSIAVDHAVHRCRTVWRSDKRIGLEFVH